MEPLLRNELRIVIWLMCKCTGRALDVRWLFSKTIPEDREEAAIKLGVTEEVIKRTAILCARYN
jgi:hypothetical protein